MIRTPRVLADGSNVVTTRTWILAALGAVLIASAGVGSLLISHGAHTAATDSSPFPVGQAFTAKEWVKVQGSLKLRGFDPTVARVVSGLRLESKNEPLALISVTSPSRGMCFLPVRGVRPGAATCSPNGHLRKPLLVYGAADRWGTNVSTEIVGIARRPIVSVSMVDRRGFGGGVALVPAPGGLWSFASGYGASKLVVRARLASGRIAAQTVVP